MHQENRFFSQAPENKSCPSTQSSAATIIGGNADLLTEILLLLPAKSLIRFKSVSKQWRSLISADSFARLHCLRLRRRAPQHSFILGLYSGIKLQYFMCDPTVKKLVRLRFPFGNNVKILQSCNGLLLLGHGKGYTKYCIFNPATLQYRELKDGGSNLSISLLNRAIYLLFDPSKSNHYRVVRFGYRSGGSISFSLYDSATHEWSSGGEAPNRRQRFFEGVTCNNRVYFTVNNNCEYYYSPEEKLCNLPNSPLYIGGGGRKKYTVESNGHLHYVRLCLTTKKPNLDVYEMIGDEWVHCKSGDHKQLKATLAAGERSKKPVELLGMVRRERVEDSMFLVHVPGQILIYRFDDKECEVLDDFRSHYFFHEDQLQFRFKDAHPFIYTLASV